MSGREVGSGAQGPAGLPPRERGPTGDDERALARPPRCVSATDLLSASRRSVIFTFSRELV